MICAEKTDIGTTHDIIANKYFPVIHDQQIEIGEKVIADIGVTAIIELNGALKVVVFADAAYELLYNGQTLRIIFIHGVELSAAFVGPMFDIPEFATSRIEQLSCKNLFLFSHSRPSFVYPKKKLTASLSQPIELVFLQHTVRSEYE